MARPPTLSQIEVEFRQSYMPVVWSVIPFEFEAQMFDKLLKITLVQFVRVIPEGDFIYYFLFCSLMKHFLSISS